MLESWQPSAPLESIRSRAELLANIRHYFEKTGVLEVETPALSRAGTTDPAIESFSSHYVGPEHPQGQQMFLHTSPEFPMKRLLAAGSGSIYQICKVFRQAESGTRHNPEFTLLEWYRVDYDHHQLMDDVAGLLHALSGEPLEVERYTYAELFQRFVGVDPHGDSVELLQRRAEEEGVSVSANFELAGRDAWLDLIMSHLIEPRLGLNGLCFVYDYPASQASLARVRDGDPPLAERFELYWRGVELANGFHELSDAAEQRQRFLNDQQSRKRQGAPEVPMDNHLLEALESGLPDCAGVALGIDRLLMLLSGAQYIEQVLAFPFARA